MADVSGQEAKVVRALKNDGTQNQIPDRYSEGPEINPGGFEDLRDEEVVALYGTLADVSAKGLADALDVSSATVSNYRSKLVEEDYLRNFQPGRGPSDYRPGLEIIDQIPDYEADVPVLEDQDAARPLETEDEHIRWLIGEELYELSEEGLYEDLSGKEAFALEMTLEGKSRDEIAGFLEVVPSSVSHYRSKLVEDGYLRNLQPGRGPAEYIPGIRMIQEMEDYVPEVEILEADPARPFDEGDGLKWLLGEGLHDLFEDGDEVEENDTEEPNGEEDEAPDIEFKLNGYSEEQVVKLLNKVEGDSAGFGRIADELGQETAHGLADDLEEEGFLDEDRERASGLVLTEDGERYLEAADQEEESSGSSFSSSSSDFGKSKSSSSGRSVRRKKIEGQADDELIEIGDELLDGHRERISQDERSGIDSRDQTDSEEDEVELEEDNAGYEGFT